jgi:hypothetical protein
MLTALSLGADGKFLLEVLSVVLVCALVRIDHLKMRLAGRERELQTASAAAPTVPDRVPELIELPPVGEGIRVVSEQEDTRLTLAAEEFGVGRLAVELERARRRAAILQAVAADILLVEHGGWMVESHVPVGEWIVPFLVLGPSGAYAVHPADGWCWEDVAIAAEVTETLAGMLEGRCHCEAILLLAFCEQPPRTRTDEQGNSAVTMGRGHLLQRLCADLHEGLSFEQLEVLDAAAAPRRRAPGP